jgi:hypothetical protein
MAIKRIHFWLLFLTHILFRYNEKEVVEENGKREWGKVISIVWMIVENMIVYKIFGFSLLNFNENIFPIMFHHVIKCWCYADEKFVKNSNFKGFKNLM